MNTHERKEKPIHRREAAKNIAHKSDGVLPQPAESIFRSLKSAMIVLCRSHGFEIELKIIDKPQSLQ